MKKIYFAGRIQPDPPKEDIVETKEGMLAQDIFTRYVAKEIKYKEYIKNGHWILRAPKKNVGTFEQNTLPSDLKPTTIWEMVKNKIQQSDIFFGTINSKSYGTLVEASYAAALNKMAVYLIFENEVSVDEKDDLWFIIQIILDTKKYWSEEDIALIPEFKKNNIFSIQDYQNYLSKVVPKFLKIK